MPMLLEDFCLGFDAINSEMWANSPLLQINTHNAHPQWPPDIGLSQALTGANGFDNNPLPFVPDLIGREANAKGAVLVVGSAYAPFMNTNGRKAMTQRQYERRRNQDVSAFSKLFIERVVEFDDGKYYDKLSLLFHPTRTVSQLILTDLCKGSFIKRRFNNARRTDFGGDKVVKGTNVGLLPNEQHEAPLMFGEYVTMAEGWTWRRLATPHLRHVVALGLIAEHGLIRLMLSHGCYVYRYINNDILPIVNPNDLRWAENPLLPNQSISWWTEQTDRWWVAEHRETKRVWKILPVHHPARVNDGYENAAPALADFLMQP